MASVFFNTSESATYARILADIQQVLKGSNPFLRNSFLLAMATANAGRYNDFYLQGQQLEQQLFPDTATGSFAVRWGSFKDIVPKVPKQAGGTDSLGNQLGLINLYSNGVVGITVPAGTGVQSTNGIQYVTLDTVLTGLQDIAISSINSVGTTAFVTTIADHHFSNNPNTASVTISGVDSTYNGTFIVDVTGPTTFNYTIAAPGAPYTGIGLAASTFAEVNVLSIETGAITNLQGGSPVNLTTPISGIQDQGFVQAYGVSGGQDAESDYAYRQRYLFSYQNPYSLFNEPAIIAACKTVQNITRVWVYPHSPIAGMVQVFFVDDNTNTSIIPSAAQFALVQQAIEAILPSHMLITDVFLNKNSSSVNLEQLSVDFTFTSLVPNTETMQASIKANLQDYFLNQTAPGVSITQDEYRSVIQNTFDEGTGEPLQSFTITTSGTIVVQTYQIPVLGTFAWP